MLGYPELASYPTRSKLLRPQSNNAGCVAAGHNRTIKFETGKMNDESIVNARKPSNRTFSKNNYVSQAEMPRLRFYELFAIRIDPIRRRVRFRGEADPRG